MFCLLGLFARPMPFDEYSFYNGVVRQGFIQAQISSYVGWTGRIFNTFLVYLCASFRLEKVQPFLPFITVITYILALFSLIGTLIPSLKSGEKFSLSFLFCALTLCFTFSLKETFYWMPGMPYFWAGTLILLALSLALKAFRGSVLSFWLCMVVLFLNGTMLEQPCVFQGVAAFLAMLFFFWRGDRKCALMSGAFWLVSVAAFCVMYFAPGTAVRMAVFDSYALEPVAHSQLVRILKGFIPGVSFGVRNTIRFFLRPLIWTIIFFVPAIAAKIPPAYEKLSHKLKFWHIVAIVFALSILMQSIAGAASYGSLPARGVSLSFWLMFLTWNMFWIFFYRGKLAYSEGFGNFCSKWKWPVLILAVLVSSNFTDCISNLRVAPDFAAEWEARVASMISQSERGIMYLQVPPLKAKPKLIYSEIAPLISYSGPTFARYYGAKNVFLVPEELSTNSEDVRKLISEDLTPYAKLAEKGDLDSIIIMAHYRDPKSNFERKDAHNLEEAFRWYTLGAEMGDVGCMRRITSLIYKDNFLEALKLRIKAYILDTRL
ncbi:MAG: hypothetical protein IJR85_02555 [Synergistaceae bacterium]|nr:hypothetical protein [Synergistaceae bacterium]